MDNPNLPNQPVVNPPLSPQPPQPLKSQKTKFILVISLLILILLFIGFFLTLKSFKRTQTNPQTQTVTQTVQSTPNPKFPHLPPHLAATLKSPSTLSITIPCPSVPEFCQNTKEVLNEEGGGLSIGNNIKAGSPIYAVFDGQSKLRTAIVDGEQFFQIDLISSQNSLRAYYFLKKIEGDQGTLSIQNSFKKGEVIATVSADPIKYLGNYNLVFKLFYPDRELPSEKITFE